MHVFKRTNEDAGKIATKVVRIPPFLSGVSEVTEDEENSFFQRERIIMGSRNLVFQSYLSIVTYLRVGREDLDPVALVAEPLGDGAHHVGVLRLRVGGHEEGEAVHHEDQRGHHVEVPRLGLLPLGVVTGADFLLSMG